MFHFHERYFDWHNTVNMTRLHLRQIPLIAAMLISSTPAICQELPANNAFVKFEGSVQMVGTQYFLIVKLSVAGDEKIKVAQERIYDPNPAGTGAAGRLTLEKRVRGHIVMVPNTTFTDSFYRASNKLVDVDQLHPINDTIILSYFYRLDNGNYRINTELDYFYKKTKYMAFTTPIEFKIAGLLKE